MKITTAINGLLASRPFLSSSLQGDACLKSSYFVNQTFFQAKGLTLFGSASPSLLRIREACDLRGRARLLKLYQFAAVSVGA